MLWFLLQVLETIQLWSANEMDTLTTARAFFDACEYGKGWSECERYCHPDATFETEAEILANVDTMEIYCDWMVDALAMFDENVEIEIKAEAHDQTRDIVLIYAEIRGNVIIGPAPMFAKTDYVYAIKFNDEKIRHISKVWELKLP
tara:strand:- start:1018 stop:1455 length:438 start_codon:yes stop_codon:yes gene_type:complete